MRALVSTLMWLGLVGCVVREQAYVPAVSTVDETVVETEPPPAQQELVSDAPSSGYVWVNGYWRWSGTGWVWAPGQWLPPRQGYTWLPGYWGRRGRVWVYRPGHWRRY